ncbi:MAG: large subunit ribosomal protein [Bacteroidota bacterium]|nr:large subunit ribosomal protein [Bacteroidota bacterium]
MEARAQKKHIRCSPRKMRLVIDMIRGKKADEALTILRFSPNHAAREAEYLLRSAISNLSNLKDGKAVDNNEVFVKTLHVDQGPTVKRIRPAPMGRAYRIRKRSNHLTIVVATQK